MASTTSIEDCDLPKTIIARVLKAGLPDNAIVAKDAKAALTKSCTVFINYLTATACDINKSSGHKSINANDIFKALEILEFDEFTPKVRAAVQAFQQNAREKRQEYKKNLMARKAGEEEGPEEDAERATEEEQGADEDSDGEDASQPRESTGRGGKRIDGGDGDDDSGGSPAPSESNGRNSESRSVSDSGDGDGDDGDPNSMDLS
ncbi:hypothetical protein HK104_011384 [Borealophlyctis nickersoniae]|nr:hypothetical protein HK104_011384 [Borealophlyctis nickersoniae]